MIETEIQTRIIEAVRAAGGAAEKISHKYVKGISDLLIKLLGYQTMLAEVKLHIRPAINATVDLEVTELQRRFLYKFERAGISCCIIAFMRHATKNYQTRELWVGVFPPHTIRARVDDFREIPKGKFNQVVIMELERWLMMEEK